MNMRKNSGLLHKKRRFRLSAPAVRIFALGFLPIFASLLRLLREIRAAGTLTEGTAAYYGKMLEYPVAALMLLTGGCLLADYIAKKGQ